MTYLLFFFAEKKKGTRRCVHCPDPLKPDFDMAWGTSGQCWGVPLLEPTTSGLAGVMNREGFLPLNHLSRKAVGGIQTPAHVVNTKGANH